MMHIGRRAHFMGGVDVGRHPSACGGNCSVEYSQGGHDHVQFTDSHNHEQALKEISASGGKIKSVNKE